MTKSSVPGRRGAWPLPPGTSPMCRRCGSDEPEKYRAWSASVTHIPHSVPPPPPLPPPPPPPPPLPTGSRKQNQNNNNNDDNTRVFGSRAEKFSDGEAEAAGQRSGSSQGRSPSDDTGLNGKRRSRYSFKVAGHLVVAAAQSPSNRPS
ncbi:hypothetical protein EYF80_019544 [Liparis tanakae]|uniref:Uncharacterized protein n=1 Tax=Liparis tanakae TaxID=230148 RepID=A0A4Z2HXS5_9TELE|nr:hypothetical protein EYF80_019544 [Liparis tanakae]